MYLCIKIAIGTMTRIYLIPIILVLTVLSGCHHADRRLTAVDAAIDLSPLAALDSLATIDRAALGEADRNYYDFLSVKAADKAYVVHTTDTVILRVIDYAAEHRSHGYYPEALYYGGRVYSDLGDYPTALTYFHQALDELPDDDANRKLRGNIISQTGRLLINLRLYDQAVTYLDKVIEMERQDHDTTNLVLDLQLLGHLYINSGQYDIAQKTITESLHLGRNLKPSHAAKSRMYLADLKYNQGDIDSALYYIRGTKEFVDSITLNSVLASNSLIYNKAGIYDSAFYYAHRIIESSDPTHKELAYDIILTRPLRKFIEPDTLDKYFDDYGHLLEGYYNTNQNTLAITQQAMYNYKQHDDARVKAEKKAQSTRYGLIGVGVALLFTVIVILYLKNRNQKNLIQLHIALETIDKLKNNIDSKAEGSNLDANALREKLRADIDGLNVNVHIEVPSSILQSRVYSTLQDYIYQKKGIPDNSNLWADLENVVLACSPNFKKYIQILSNGNISAADYRTALLIKCNISSTNMSHLFQLTRTAINSRRTSLSKKLFGESMGVKLGDALIRSL